MARTRQTPPRAAGGSRRGTSQKRSQPKAGATAFYAAPAINPSNAPPKKARPAAKPVSNTRPKIVRGAKEAEPKVAVTLRLPKSEFMRLELMATAENRTPTNFVETAVLQSMAAKEEVARVITMYVPDDAKVKPGPLLRSEGESDERYAARSALVDQLLAIGDTD